MKSKQTLKVGQKYRVIKDCEDACCEGTIVTVDIILDDGWFWDKESDLGFNLKHDKLQLITPKKEVKKWKYSREYLSQVYKDNEGANVNDFVFDLLAKQSTPNKMSNKPNISQKSNKTDISKGHIAKPNNQKTDWESKLKLVREISEAMAYEYSVYDAMNNNDTPEDIAVNLLDKFLSTQREEIISEIEGILGEDEEIRDYMDGYLHIECDKQSRNQFRNEIRERLKQITNLKEK